MGLAAVVLLAVRLAAPTIAQASTDKLVVTVSNRSPGSGTPFTVTAHALNAQGHTDTSFNGPATRSDLSGYLTPSTPSAFMAQARLAAAPGASEPMHMHHTLVPQPPTLRLRRRTRRRDRNRNARGGSGPHCTTRHPWSR